MRNELENRVAAIEERFKKAAMAVLDDWFDGLPSIDRELIVRWAEGAREAPVAPLDLKRPRVGFTEDDHERLTELLGYWQARICREMSNGRR